MPLSCGVLDSQEYFSIFLSERGSKEVFIKHFPGETWKHHL